MAEQPQAVKCGDCPKLVTPQKTWSDRNGNQGRFYVMVSIMIFCIPRSLLLIFVFCSKGTTERPHPQWFRFVSELTPSPALPPQEAIPNTYSAWITPTEIQHPVAPESGFEQTTCVVTGCDKRINQKCARHACAGHCRIQGGCPLAAHAPKISDPSQAPPSFPSQSSLLSRGIGHVFVPATQQGPSTPLGDAQNPMNVPEDSEPSQAPPSTFPSQSRVLSQGISHVFVPTTQQGPSTPISENNYDQNAVNLPAGYGPTPPILPHQIQPITSGPHLEPPTSMNPLPNPRYSSQIRPIFTEELAQKQELLRTRQIQDAERPEAANRAKHEVTVCAWLSVSQL